MWRRMILPGGGRSREPGPRMGEVKNSEERNQWGCRAVVEDHTALLFSASGSVRKEALCRICKGSDASRVLYQEMSARLLQLASKHDTVECATLLLEGGSPIMASRIEARDQLTTTRLHVAAETHSARCIELLKNARADLRVVDERPLLRLEIALTSIRVWLMDNPIEDLLSFLHGMVGDMNVIKILNVDVNEASSEANTTLHWCLIGGDGDSSTQEPRFVRLLLKNDARVFQWNKSGLTPLHTGVAKALQSLLLHGQGCVDIPAKTKGSPLFFAVKDGSVNLVIQLLLPTGADTKAWNLRKQGTIDDVATSKETCFFLCSANVVRWNHSSPQKNHVIRKNYKELLGDEFDGSDNDGYNESYTALKTSVGQCTVNIHFCDRKFRSSPTEDSSVLSFIQSVLRENSKKTNDFYLRMNNRILDGDTKMNKIILLKEPTIEVCPRLRGGVHPLYESQYERFTFIFTNNMANLFRDVIIPQGLMTKNSSSDATFLSPLSQNMLHGILAHVLSDGHLERGVSWDGQITSDNVLISADGHVMVDPAIVPVQYTDVGGEKDYDTLYWIGFDFAFNQKQKRPVHFDHLLKMLKNSTANLRRNKLFVLLLVSHPSLLSYCEKYKLYGLVQLLLKRLTPKEDTDLDNWLNQNSGGYDQWQSLVLPNTAFETTFLFHAKKDSSGNKVSVYKSGLRQGFQFGRNFEAHPPTSVLNSMAEDALDHSFFFLLTIILEGLVKTLQPGQSAHDLADILSNLKADPATMRKFWSLDPN